MTKTKIVGSVKWVNENESTGDEKENSSEEINSDNEYEQVSRGLIALTSEGFYLFPCPHCASLVQVKLSELNCRIFRHGTFKKNGKAINPHLKKKKCEELVKRACVYGCAKPFEFIGGGKENPEDTECIVRECGYI